MAIKKQSRQLIPLKQKQHYSLKSNVTQLESPASSNKIDLMTLTKRSAKIDSLTKSSGISVHTFRAEQDKKLRADVESVLSCQKLIKSQTNQCLDSSRILVVLAAGSGAEKYLSHTIPKIIAQIAEVGARADILIGLNHGFECPHIIDSFNQISNVETIDLYTEEKVSNQLPAKLYAHANAQGEPYFIQSHPSLALKHRIFVIHQKISPYSAGKIRILGDIYGSLLINSIAQGWHLPALLITIDAESQFLLDQPGLSPNLDSNGLQPILEQLNHHPEIDILGATPRHTVYQPVERDGSQIFLPDFSQDVPPIPWFLNIVHGYYPGYQLKPGGGTVGRSDVIISLLTVISERYPGARLEDIQLTILAEHAGFKHELCMDVIQTNRVPDQYETVPDNRSKLAWLEQMARWMSGIEALKINYGQHNIEAIVADTFPWAILLNPRLFVQSLRNKQPLNLITLFKVARLLIGSFLNLYLLKAKAAGHPDTLQGYEAKATW